METLLCIDVFLIFGLKKKKMPSFIGAVWYFSALAASSCFQNISVTLI
jgi:hypothetical protein